MTNYGTLTKEDCKDCGVSCDPTFLENGLCRDCDAHNAALNEEAWREP